VSTDTTPGAGDDDEQSAQYRRRGTVTAHRLIGPRHWTSEGGERLEVQAGDWWVTDDSGVSRGVADKAFRATYRPVGGSRYTRVGTVSARRTDTSVVVQTQEGPATAEPGTWVVTDSEDHSWPVPPDVFEAGYEAVAEA
jgi:hypothetical protein